MTKLKGILSAGFCLGLFFLTACDAAPARPPIAASPAGSVSHPTEGAALKTFYIVGYFTDWEDSLDAAPFDELTHINYAFLLPNTDGSLDPIRNEMKLKTLVTRAHAARVKVLISIGGWGLDSKFEALASEAASRARFVDAAADFMDAHQLDGIDIDWEYPDAGSSSEHFAALMDALSGRLRPRGKLLTAAAAALGRNADGVSARVFDDVDFLNLMVYDGENGPGHSPYQFALDSLAYWSARGLPPEKTVLGVPFYSRPGEIPYRDLVMADGAAAQQDQISYDGQPQYFNGIPTIVKKTELAMAEAAGIMFWTIGDDSMGETSLIRAIYATVHK